MEIKKNSLVKIFCLNGLIEGGKLIEYTDDQFVLNLIDESFFIVQDPKKNIIAIKVLSEKPKENNQVQKQVFVESPVKLKQELQQNELDNNAFTKEALNIKSLAELHKLRAEEERKRAKELLTQKTISSNTAQEVNFGFPSFIKPSIPKHPKKKT